MYDCKISEDMQAYELQMSQCDVMATVGIVWYNGYLKGSIQCNRFLSSGYLAVSPGVYSSGAIDCEISITGNYSDHDFWDDSAFVGVTHSTTGKIVYEGNYGGCPGNEFDTVDDMTFSVETYPYNAPGDITDLPAHISEIKQQCVIAVEEEGTEAAAVTMAVCVAGCPPPDDISEPITMKIDRPFGFAIRGDYSQLLFMGIVKDMSENQS